MRILLLAFALALPLFAATYENVVIRDGDHSYIDGDGRDVHASTLGRHYATFERDGVGYIIRDEATLARLRKAMQPQLKLGREQARLGEQQAELGARQAALGTRQAALGTQQAISRADQSRRFEAQQQELARQQEKLADEQRPLADAQRVLADKQRVAAREGRRQIEKIFDEAIRNGIAKRR